MKTILSIIYVVLGCVISFAHAQQSEPSAIASQSDIVGGMQLFVKLDRNIYSPADKIFLELVLTNTTDNAVIITSDIPEIVYEINMNYVDDMRPAKRTQYGDYLIDRARMSSSKPMQVPGHGHIKQSIIINRIYDMTLPGTYRINVHREIGLPDGGTARSVKTDELSVVVYEKTRQTYSIKTSPSQ